jgi:hypothetical protein
LIIQDAPLMFQHSMQHVGKAGNAKPQLGKKMPSWGSAFPGTTILLQEPYPYDIFEIAIIQPDGEVIGWIDLEGLLSSEECAQDVEVLNGIAHNDENDSMYVTGKYWCKLFELELVP